jgi:hypothetical protein
MVNEQSMSQETDLGTPYDREPNWRTAALVGASLTIGALLGASVALLLAPRTGEHTRLALARGMRRRLKRKTNVLGKFGIELPRHRNGHGVSGLRHRIRQSLNQ